jgi:dTDP-4-dehydrorhamnose 3,5-epimerase
MSERFEFTELSISGLYHIDRKPIKDTRGNFSRFFCAEELKSIGFNGSVAQMNLTLTKQKGTVRGLHFQRSPYSEQKIVTCLSGKIFDVAVDLRENSPTYLRWHSEILSKTNGRSLFIPEGFAHGFQTLVPNCQLLYIHSEFYTPEVEGGLSYNDPKLAIKWPEEVTFVSKRDKSHPKI